MIYIICAPPRSGKTYFATRLALSEMIPKKSFFGKIIPGKRVYSNYPIYDKKTGLSSLVWKPEYIYQNIQDSVIIIDEAYREFGSRNYKDFDIDKHHFFATNGHNGFDVYVIVQNPSRVDVIIREMTNEMYFVRKFQLPFMSRPLWFVVYCYQDLNEMGKLTPSERKTTSKKVYFFKKSVADAYDTHFFRKDEPEFVPHTWFDELEERRWKKQIDDLFGLLGVYNTIDDP